MLTGMLACQQHEWDKANIPDHFLIPEKSNNDEQIIFQEFLASS